MKFFVLTSAAIHIAAFFLMASVMEINPSRISAQPLHATLTGGQNERIKLGNAGAKNALINHEVEKEDSPQTEDIVKEAKTIDSNESDISQPELQMENYYSPTEVEIVALPTSNLDSSMFSDLFISGLPIKMRLYINALGHVVKIDHIDLLEQNLLMAKRLEVLLKQITFLPAKRNGVNVDSYRDIEFSFQ